jgi:hypothetical protein
MVGVVDVRSASEFHRFVGLCVYPMACLRQYSGELNPSAPLHSSARFFDFLHRDRKLVAVARVIITRVAVDAD